MTKPLLAFVGSLKGVPLCSCNTEMKLDAGIYRCPNLICERSGKKYTAIVSNKVLFYEVKER